MWRDVREGQEGESEKGASSGEVEGACAHWSTVACGCGRIWRIMEEKIEK